MYNIVYICLIIYYFFARTLCFKNLCGLSPATGET